jgi:transposase
VELYARVRRAVHVEGRSQREVAREFGLARKTVRKMLAYPAPPGYQRQKPVLRPKLGPWQDAIDAILEEDKSRPRRQRHTAKRIFERLRESTARKKMRTNYARRKFFRMSLTVVTKRL